MGDINDNNHLPEETVTDSETDGPDFDLGLHSDEIEILYESCDMDVDDVWSDSDDMVYKADQIGRGQKYTIELTKERKIAKFNVQGYDYKVRVDNFERNMSFDQAVQALHSIIEGGYASSCHVNP